MIVRATNYNVRMERDYIFSSESFGQRVASPAPGGQIEITLLADYTDEALRILQSDRVLELLPHDPNRKPAPPPGDEERRLRLQEEDDGSPHWSGCPDCSSLPCVCDVDMF